MNLPNLISLARLLAVPLTVWLLIEGRLVIAFWVFVGAGISDAIDGFLARQLNSHSALGAYLDPLADKALLVSVYVTLGYIGMLADWLVILVVFRDVLIVGGVILVAIVTGPVEAKPLFVSKLNTTLQIVLAAFALGNFAFDLDLVTALIVLTYAVAATTLVSGAAYIRQLIWRDPPIEAGE